MTISCTQISSRSPTHTLDLALPCLPCCLSLSAVPRHSQSPHLNLGSQNTHALVIVPSSTFATPTCKSPRAPPVPAPGYLKHSSSCCGSAVTSFNNTASALPRFLPFANFGTSHRHPSRSRLDCRSIALFESTTTIVAAFRPATTASNTRNTTHSPNCGAALLCPPIEPYKPYESLPSRD